MTNKTEKKITKSILKEKVWWAILTDRIGFEKRLKVPTNYYVRSIRYPVKRKRVNVYFNSEGDIAIPQTELETVKFEYESKSETDTAVYLYYAESE